MTNTMCVKMVPEGVEPQPIPRSNIQVCGATLKTGVQIFVKLSRCIPHMIDTHCVALNFRCPSDDPDDDDGVTVNFEQDEFPLSVLPTNYAVAIRDLIQKGYEAESLIDLALSKIAAVNAMVMISRTGPRYGREVMVQLRIKEFFTCRKISCADIQNFLTFF